MTDQDAIDYFLLQLINNIKYEYNKDPDALYTEDKYIIKRLNEIAHNLSQISKI